MIYIIGSLRSPRPALVGDALRSWGYKVFDDWHAAGPTADDEWKRYERQRGRGFTEALDGAAARQTFAFDLHHLTYASAGVLVLPAGRSGHLELGWLLGRGKPGWILLDGDAERWDVMYRFATGVCQSLPELRQAMAQALKEAA